jgi:hypothetical protein
MPPPEVVASIEARWRGYLLRYGAELGRSQRPRPYEWVAAVARARAEAAEGADVAEGGGDDAA